LVTIPISDDSSSNDGVSGENDNQNDEQNIVNGRIGSWRKMINKINSGISDVL